MFFSPMSANRGETLRRIYELAQNLPPGPQRSVVMSWTCLTENHQPMVGAKLLSEELNPVCTWMQPFRLSEVTVE